MGSTAKDKDAAGEFNGFGVSEPANDANDADDVYEQPGEGGGIEQLPEDPGPPPSIPRRPSLMKGRGKPAGADEKYDGFDPTAETPAPDAGDKFDGFGEAAGMNL